MAGQRIKTFLKLSTIAVTGFIVVELVCLAVVGLQEVSRRAECRNNLRHTALSVINHHDVYLFFPPATVPNPDLAVEQRPSWLLASRFFLEGNKELRRLDLKATWDGEKNWFMTGAACRVYLCPSHAGDPPPRDFNLTSYVGVSGVGEDAAVLPVKDKRCGFFGYDRQIKEQDISDGKRQTMMITETAINNGPWAQGGKATVRGVVPGEEPYVGEGRPFGRSHRPGWYWHKTSMPACANAAMADGSVRAIRRDISRQVFEALATIAGEEEVPDDW
jgi:hypothetical protein